MKAVEFMTLEVFYESGNGGVSFSPNKLLPGVAIDLIRLYKYFVHVVKTSTTRS